MFLTVWRSGLHQHLEREWISRPLPGIAAWPLPELCRWGWGTCVFSACPLGLRCTPKLGIPSCEVGGSSHPSVDRQRR